MNTRIDEVAAGIYRIATFASTSGITFNQYLIDADEPLLFHCGQRSLFADVSAAVARVVSLNKLRWISFSHVEADECGALNDWLALAPQATVIHGKLGCTLWLNEMSDRAPRALANDAALDLGGKRVRWLDTPHVPHNWDAGMLFEETGRTLFCSDLFTQAGDTPPLTTSDILGPALVMEKRIQFSGPAPQSPEILRRLAGLSPDLLAVMHGSAYSGDGAAALEGLAAAYEKRLNR